MNLNELIHLSLKNDLEKQLTNLHLPPALENEILSCIVFCCDNMKTLLTFFALVLETRTKKLKTKQLLLTCGKLPFDIY